MSGLGHKVGDFPVAEAISSSVLSLPIYPELEASQQAHVIDKIHSFYS
jgi:dTDP-4-amino-4,6-dideoxygalactose transaminase